MKPVYHRFLVTCLGAMGALSSSARAARLYKDVTTTDLNVVANWATTSGGATDPLSIGTTDALRFNEVFAPTSGTNYTVALSGNLSVGGIELDSGTGNGGVATGNVTISAGNTLTLNGASAADIIYAAGGIVMNSSTGGTLTINADVNLGGAQQWVTSRVLTVGGNINLNANTLSFNVAGSTQNLNGVISGTGSLNKTAGGGTLALSNTGNSFSGTVTLVGGTTTVTKLANGNNNSSLGSGTSAIVLNGAVLAYSGTTTDTTDRAIDMRAGAAINNNGVGGTISFTAANVIQGGTASARTLTLGGSNTNANTFGSIVNDSGTGVNITTLQKSGLGTWVLSGANTYTGGTIVNQGILRVMGSGALGGVVGSVADAGNIWFTSANAGGTIEFETSTNLGVADQIRFRNTGGTAGSGAQLKYIGTTTQVVSKAIQCDTTVGVRLSSDSVGGSVEFSGSWANTTGNRPIYLGGTGTGDNTISGSISANGSGSLNKVDAGKWILTGTNSYTGATNITNGILQLGNGGTTGKLSASSAITNNGNLTIKRSNAVTQGTDFSSAAITGTGSFTAAGTGTITLNVANSYGGGTTVNAGADLRINGAQTGAGAVNVAATGKLGGSGSVIGGINVSGVLAPGNSIESLGGGALSFATGSTYAYEFQTNLYAGSPGVAGDLTYSSGTLTIASGTILTLNDLATSTVLANGSKLTLISSVGGWNGGLFSYNAGAGLVTLGDDSMVVLGVNKWWFNYNDSSGGVNYTPDQSGATNFVTMTVVPEPAAVVLGSIGLLALLRRRRLK